MFYESMGRIHAAAYRAWSGTRGQGTVEYVGLILLVAVVIAAVVKAGHGLGDSGIAKTIVNKLKGAIDSVTADKK